MTSVAANPQSGQVRVDTRIGGGRTARHLTRKVIGKANPHNLILRIAQAPLRNIGVAFIFARLPIANEYVGWPELTCLSIHHASPSPRVRRGRLPPRR